MERVVTFRVRTILLVLGLIIAVWALLAVVRAASNVIVWMIVALFLALAINPLVELLQRRGIRSRSAAAAVAVVLVILFITAIAATLVPTLISNVNHFVNAVPGYVDDLTKGKGRAGFLETKYHVVEKLRAYVHKNGAKGLLGLSNTAITVTQSVLGYVVGAITVGFLTLFMLLEGPTWIDRFYSLLPERSQPRWRRIGSDIYSQVSGYVTGNLLISLIAGSLTTLVLLLLGVPYAVALGLIVAVLDLIPLVGATIAAVIIAAVAFLHSVKAGIISVGFFVIYQQVENQILQPVVYHRTVKLSPLTILVSVLIGGSLAGILGALAAIPVAGAIQVLIKDYLSLRRERTVQPVGPAAEN